LKETARQHELLINVTQHKVIRPLTPLTIDEAQAEATVSKV